MKESDKFFVQQCFLRMLTEGTHSLSGTELNKWDKSLSLSLQSKALFCVVVTASGTAFDGEAVIRLRAQCKKALVECSLSGYVIVGNNMDVLLILPDLGELHEWSVQQLANCISQRTNQSIRLGVGNIVSELSQLHCSRDEAYEALSWTGEEILIADIRDICNRQPVSYISIQNSRKRIIDYFRKGVLDDLQKDLEVLAEQVRTSTVIYPDAPYPTSIRRTMVELLVEMMHIASDEGVDVDAQIGNADPYRKIFELLGTPAIIKWVVEVAQALSKDMQARKKLLETNVLAKAKQFIQTHLSDIELNLSIVSESVGMTSSYFSAFFIRETGVGFKEYVTAERIKLAKILLLESKDSINLISEQCGFLSPSYFINVFKKQTGLTPGQYRKAE